MSIRARLKRSYSVNARRMKHSFIREILKSTKGVPGMISFAGGLPSPASFPKEILQELFREVIAQEGDDVLQYGPSEGDPIFRRVIKEYEEVPDLPDGELMILIGSTNGIYYYTETFADPGDVILCELPSFPGSLTAFEACGAQTIGVPMDEHGMVPHELSSTIARIESQGGSVKFIYVIPEFQNPTGITMPLERRRAIVNVASRYGLPLLEDSPYRELRYRGERIPTLWEIARNEYGDTALVTIMKSFSKILGPGLRLGFAAGPPEVIDPMVKWAQKITVSPDGVAQRVAARFIQRGHIYPHVEMIIRLYGAKLTCMMESLDEHMPPGVTWTRPEGGMFTWLTLPPGLDSGILFQRAKERMVAFIPSANFYPRGCERQDGLRLNFSYPTEDEIREGLQRLGQVIREAM